MKTYLRIDIYEVLPLVEGRILEDLRAEGSQPHTGRGLIPDDKRKKQ